MKKLNIFVALVATLFAFGAQAQDTVTILPPFKGIEEAFVMKFHRVNYDTVYQVTSVSTSGASGYYPVDFKLIPRDTIRKLFTDTIRKGLQSITIETSFDVKIELYLKDKVTLVASSGVTTVNVQPVALTPGVSIISSVNNNKVIVNLGIDINVATRLYAYTVTNASDTLNPLFPRKSWPLFNTAQKSFTDSSYVTKKDVWMCYQITDTIDSKLTTKTKWVFVPGYTVPAIVDMEITYAKDSTPSILKVYGWIITKNLPATIKLALASGDTMSISVPASNGLTYWSAVAVNRIPGKTYSIIAYGINAKGKKPSNIIVHTMGSNPTVVTISTLSPYSDGYNLVVDFSYSLPSGKTGEAIISYTKDTDPNFNEPIKGNSFYGLTGSGAKNCLFPDLAPGKYLVRCELNDGKDLVTKITTFTLHSLSTNKVTSLPILVYPNPATDVIHSNQPITLFNSLGEKVTEGDEIFIENLPRGFYYYKALGQNSFSGKVMLE
ncbi:MAG: hypothetical protein QG566_56 [Patescibacteria group bacterium]|nr:hypothetical protein [Patescibacteria group bacterium]